MAGLFVVLRRRGLGRRKWFGKRWFGGRRRRKGRLRGSQMRARASGAVSSICLATRRKIISYHFPYTYSHTPLRAKFRVGGETHHAVRDDLTHTRRLIHIPVARHIIRCQSHHLRIPLPPPPLFSHDPDPRFLASSNTHKLLSLHFLQFRVEGFLGCDLRCHGGVVGELPDEHAVVGSRVEEG